MGKFTLDAKDSQMLQSKSIEANFDQAARKAEKIFFPSEFFHLSSILKATSITTGCSGREQRLVVKIIYIGEEKLQTSIKLSAWSPD